MIHSEEFLAVVNDAKSRIREIDVAVARERVAAGAVLIDVREDSEWFEHAADAVHIGRGVIERDIVFKYPDKTTEMVLYCGGGYRSALATDNLRRMGYTNVYSMDGGWTAWKASGAPTDMEIPF
jgi:rhodanese-related sulfurtransferase